MKQQKISRLRFIKVVFCSLFVGLMLFGSGQSIAFAALSDSDRQAILNDTPFYDPSSGACSLGFDSGSSGSGSGVWDSGLKTPYILQQFMIEVLKDIAQKTRA